MSGIKVLDCTLRDGGYCNEWMFGFDNIKKIVKGLVDAEIDIIECGFLVENLEYQQDATKFSDLMQLSTFLPSKSLEKLFVAMINYGEYDVERLPQYDGYSIDGIRVAFHKKDLLGALEVCRIIKQKGYKVFVQPMVSLSYTDIEFINLINMCNEIEPYAFYIVDSFGAMNTRDLNRLFSIVENNLKSDIWIGFHSHNNMQLSYSSAQNLIHINTNRNIVIDSSIYGMGRGAGNLNTELLIQYLNEVRSCSYKTPPLLNIIDEIINLFYEQNHWGFSLPNYLSAVYNTHPNYAAYLSEKNTLTYENMDQIFSIMDDEKRITYDKKYIEQLYIRYMARSVTYEEHLFELKEILSGKEVLIIAPGKSIEEENEKIIDFLNLEGVISICVGFDDKRYKTDFIFISNLRRYRAINNKKSNKMIVTSNIPADEVFLQVDYQSLLNDIEVIKDNSLMMLIQFLLNMDVKKIALAGVDGYSHEISENYASHSMAMIAKTATLDAMNAGMSRMLQRFREKIELRFITKPKYVNVNFQNELSLENMTSKQITEKP